MLQFLLRNGKACAPRFFILPTLVFLFAFIGNQGFAQNSLYENYITLNLNGAGNTTYNLTNPGVVTGTTGLTNFDGVNLGTYTPGTNTLVLTGARNILENCDGCDYSTGNKLYYRTYLTSGSGGAYSNATLTANTEINPFYSCGSLQEWKETGLGINVLSGLSAGTYYLEVYTEAACSSGTLTLNNSGANYKATFTVSSNVTVTSTGGTTSAGYSTFAAALAAINGGTHTGTIVCTVNDGYTETAPAGGFVITATGTVSNTITFQRGNTGGAKPIFTASNALTAGTLNDGIFKIVGGDYITIDGFDLRENGSNTTTAAASNNMTEFGVALFYASTTNGAQNNTIKNCSISLNRSYSNTFGIYSNVRASATAVTTTADITLTTGANSGNKVYSNTISNVDYGIVFIGSSTAAAMDNGNDVGGSSTSTGNTITNWGGLVSGATSAFPSLTASNFCIFMNHQINDNTSYNSITSATGITTVTTSTFGGILKNYSGASPTSGTTNVSTISNNTVTLTNTPTTGGMVGVSAQASTSVANSSATLNMNNNTVVNCAINGGTTASFTGILNSYAPGTMNITGNTIRGLTTAVTGTSSVIGIVQQTNGVVTALNITNNKLGDATAGFVTFSGTANSSTVTGISVTSAGAASTCALAITGNDIRGITHTNIGGGAHTYIINAAVCASQNISSNTFTNLSVNTTGSITFISNSVNAPSAGFKTINNNSIVTAFNKTGAGGTVALYNDGASSTATAGVQNNNNNFSNITVTGATSITGWFNNDGTGSTPVKTITGNTFSNWTCGTSSVIVLQSNFGNPGSITGNTITNITGQSAVTGLLIGSSGTVSALNVSNNSVTGLSSTGTGGAVTGISNAVSSTTLASISNNTVNTLSSSSTTATVAGISTSASAGITGNTIHTLSSLGTTSGAANGIMVTGGATVSVSKNKIYNLSTTGAFTTTPGVNGIVLSGAVSSATVNVSNNLIGDLKAAAANSTDAIRGISVTATGTSGTYNIFYNTVYLSASSSGANFGTTGIFHAASATATTAALNLRNNIIVNKSAPAGTGLTVAYRRSAGTSGTLANYSSTSNNNIFYAGTPGASNLIYSDGTSSAQTMSGYKTGIFTAGTIAPRDASSQSEDVSTSFISTTGSNAGFLHLTAGATTLAESGGAAISGFTDDFDGDTRNASTPDIGADEFAGTSPAPAITLAITPSAAQCTPTARTVSATVTTPTGTISSVTLNYNNGSAGSATMVLSSGSNTNGVWTATLPAAAISGTTVTWSVSAVSDVPLTTTATGASFTDKSPTISSFTVSPGTVCEGSNVTLTAVSGSFASGTATVGTQSTTEFGGGVYRYGAGTGDDRHQLLFTAAELTAAGLTSGNITAITFNVTSAGGGSANNYTIKMANTSATALSTTFQTGTFTTVYTATTYTAISGNNVHTFTTPFNWDGTSNILVDICYNISTTGSTSTVAATTPSFVSNNQLLITTSACTATSGATTFANRPLTAFTGTVGTNLTSTLTWVFNPGSVSGTNTGIATVNPTTSTTYSVTATDANNCSTTFGTTASVTVNPLPATPTGTADSHCGTGTSTWTATSSLGSGESFRWYATNSSNTVLGTNSTYSEINISTTTTRYLAVWNGTCESSRTAIVSNVTIPDALTAKANGSATPSASCPNVAIALSETQAGSTNIYTYTWTCISSNAATSGISGSVTGASVSVTPTASGTYTYMVTGVDGSCTTSSSVTIVVATPPVITSATATPNPVCSGSAVTLNGASSNVVAGTITLGTGSDVSTLSTDGTPYRMGNTVGNQFKNQYLFLASELQAAGLSAGNITSVALTISGSGGGTLSNFTIKMGTTSQTAMTSTYVTGLTQVLSLGTYPSSGSVTTGVQTHTFTTPFNWDGTSNIVLEICAQLATSGSSGTLAGDTKAFAATILNSPTTTACASATAGGGTSTVRPKVTFGGPVGTNNTGLYTWVWNPGNINAGTTGTTTVNPVANTTYTVTATDAAGCSTTSSDVNVTVTALPSAPTGTGSNQCGTGTATWTATSSLGSGESFRWYATNNSTTVLGTNSTYTESISATTIRYLAVWNGICESNRTAVTASVIAPDALTAQANGSTTPAAVCPNVSAALSAVQTGATNVYTYTWTASPQAGSGIPAGGTVGQSINVTPTTPGTYIYTVTGVDGTCTAISTVTLTVSAPFGGAVTSVSAVASVNPVCSGSSTSLTATLSPPISSGAYCTPVYTNFDGTDFISNVTIKDASGTNTLFTRTSGSTALPCYDNQTALTTTTLTAGITYTISLTQGSSADNLAAFIDFNQNGSFTDAGETIMPSTATAASGTNTVSFTVPSGAYNGSTRMRCVQRFSAAAASCNTSGFGETEDYTITITGGATNLTNVVNYTWSDGTGTIGTTNPLSVSPTTNTTYTVTASDANGCGLVSSGFLVTVSPVPSAPTGTGSNQCGTGTATWTATSSLGSDESFRWYATNSSTTVLGTNTTYSENITTTTTRYLAVWNGTCESSRTAVVASVILPDAITANANGSTTPSAVCPNTSVALTAVQTGSTNVYTYTWTASPQAGSGIPAGGTIGQNINVTPAAAGTYTYTVTGIDGTCTTTSSVSVTVNTPPNITSATATPSTVCAGSTVTLNGTSGSIGAGSVTLGAGSDVSTLSTSGTPYRMGNTVGNQFKNQYLFLASELQAAGLQAGNITSIKTFIAGSGGGTLSNFTIKLGTTTQTAMTTTYVTGLSTVLSLTTYPATGTVTTGLQTHNFTTSFNWDGTSNLVVEICAQLATSGSAGTLAGDPTAFASTIQNSPSASGCTSTTGGGTFNVRPAMTFGGQTGVNTTSSNTWVWNPGNISAGTTGTATVNPTTSTTYTVTATDANGCSTTSSNVVVTVNPVPSAPTGAGTPQCGVGTATWTATSSLGSGESFRWYATNSSNAVLGTNTTYTETISITTTRYLAVWNGNCESSRAAVTVTVTQPDALTANANGSATPANVCPDASVALTAVQTGFTNVYTYTWTASPQAGSGIPVGGTAGQNISVTPTTPGTYIYTVTGVDGTCTAVSSVTLVVNTPPVIISATASPAVTCAGGTVTLTALTGSVSAGSATVGTQTTTEFGGSVYRLGFGTGDFRHQLLFTAAELTAAGLQPGNMTALTFNVTTVGSGSADNYNIRMANTSATALSATFQTGTFTAVFSAASYTPVAGNNVHTFSTPFNWDGTSNVLIDICYSVSLLGSSSTVAANTPAFLGNNQLLGSAGACSAASGATTAANRPLLTIAGQVGSTGAGSYSWVWNPGNLSGNSVQINPTVSGSYTVTATDGAGCSTTSSPVSVTVSTGASISADPVSITRCNGTTATFSVTATAPGTVTYQWRKGGVNINTTTNPSAATATLTLTGVSAADAGSYDVVVTGTCGASATSAAATLTVPQPVAGINASATTICSGNSVTLTENGGNATSWSPGGSTTQAITVSPTSTVTYTVTATLNGCSATAGQIITVNPSPTAISITPSSSTLCPTDNPVLLTANGGTGSVSGTALSQDFSAANGWTVSNATYSATNTNWVIAQSPLNDASGTATFTNFSTTNGGGFAYANSDAGGSGSSTNTKLISPVFSLTGYTSANLTFEHVYRNWAGSSQADTIVAVYISTNGGSTYSLLKDYKALGSQGTTTSNSQATTNESINLSAYLGQSNLRLLWYYNSGWGFFWIVDNVQVTGQAAQSSIVWTPNGSGSGLYTDAAGTTAYTGSNTTTVYAKPATGSTATYTATATLGTCSVSNTATVTVNPNNGTTTTTSACDSYTWAVNGVTYTSSGTYTYTSGCDIYTLNLTITPSTSNTTNASACDSYTWSVNGVTYTSSGTYTYVSGCHTEVLNLTITPSTSNTTTASACDSYTWSVNGVTYTSSGTYTYVSGCHTEVLNLTITPSSTNTTAVTAAGSYTWSVNGVTYTSSGTYTYVSGCHTEILNLTITPATVTLNVKMYIQGYYTGGGQMQPVLMNEGVGSSATDVDNVTVELHDAADPSIISATATGVLQTDGTMSVTMPSSVNSNSYYIAIKHRNTVQTWSANPVAMSSVTSYDFSTDAAQAYGSNMTEVESGVWAMYTGDINQDEFIDVFDYPDYDSDNFNLVSGAYVATDLNGDGFVDVFDYPIYDANNFNLISSVHP